MTLTVGILRAGTNTHLTSSEEANAVATDFVVQGIVGALTNTGGVAPATGGFAVNAQASPNTTVAVSAGVGYVTGTPTSQGSQTLRVKNSVSTNVTIAANSSGSTKYDFLYVKLDPTNLADPNTAADNVATLVTSRSSNATTDDGGSTPTYGYCIAVVTVANGFSTITNGNITDKRTQAGSTPAITGTESALVTIRSESTFDYIASGCVWTADSAGSTRNASMTAGVVYIAGKRLTVASVAARSFTASKDVYVGVIDAGNGTATVVYYDNTTNTASPSLVTAGYTLILAIVVVGASSIATAASINQGQEDRVLPIASSIAYTVTDSLGNLICPRDPNRKILGYRQIVATFTGSGFATQQITGLTCPVIVPTGRKVKIDTQGAVIGGTGTNTMNIFDGSVGSGTQVQQVNIAAGNFLFASATVTPTTASKTYNAAVSASSGTVSVTAGSTLPAFIRVELA